MDENVQFRLHGVKIGEPIIEYKPNEGVLPVND